MILIFEMAVSRHHTFFGNERDIMLQVFFSSSLRKHVDDYDPVRGMAIQVKPNTTVSDVCDGLGIPKTDVKIVMVDGKGRSMDYKLKGNERVALFPPMGGG